MRRSLLAALALGLLAAGAPARADERETLRRLERALDRAEADPGSGPEAELGAVLADLERDDARQRQAFDAAAQRRLPPKARERLARTRAAYAEGQAPLLAAVRSLARRDGAPRRRAGEREERQGASASAGAEPRAATLARAREALLKIEKASRREPLSAALNVRAPEPTTATLAEQGPAAPVGPIPAILKTAAAALAGPVEVYDFVRQSIRPEYYHGVMKGPVQTYLEQAGNDADTAALLVMLLRAKGFEARYVRGTALVPAAALAAHTGTASVEQAVRVLERGGVPHEVVLGAGGVASVKWERTWVEVYVPYVNYRGAILDAHGKTWVPLDAAFKPLAKPSGLDVVAALGFDAGAAVDDYLQGSARGLPSAFVRARVTGLLNQQRPGTSYVDVLNQRTHDAPSFGLLPSTLPYAVEARPDPSYDLDASLDHTVHVVGEAAGVPILDARLSVASVLGRRLTLSYVPFSPDDAEVVAQYGSLPQTPPFLIEVRPVLTLGGVPVATGTGSVGMAVKYTLRLEFSAPRASETVTNTVLAGNLIAIGLGGRRVTAGEVRESLAAEILAARAWSYLHRWNASDEELADLLRVVPVRPLVSACLALSDVESSYAGGDPLYPLSFEWKGIAIDADLRSTAPVGVETREREKDFLRLSGLEGSVLENKVFEDDLRIESVSTAKALQLAREQGIEVLDLDPASGASVLAGLPLDPGVKAEIESALLRGLRVRVPAQDVRHLAWSGVGYLLLDEETAETGWQLQGGHSGGVTAPAVIDIPAELKDPLAEQREEPPPSDVVVAKLERFLSRDFQFGTVDKELPLPLKVLLSDADGYAVPNGFVVFQVLGGGGSLLDPLTGQPAGSRLTVVANEKGEAEARLKLGRLTGEIPRFVQGEGEAYATQVGLNLVTADAGGAALQEPFSAFGEPDDRFDGTDRYVSLRWQSSYPLSNDGRLELAGVMNLLVTDQHENPISNWPILFRYQPLPQQLDPPPGWYHMHGPTDTPAVLLSRSDYQKCLQTTLFPIKGECAGEADQVTDLSSTLGAGAVVILGDSPFSRYRFDVGTQRTPGVFQASFTTAEYMCPVPPTAQTCLGEPRLPDIAIVNQGARPALINQRGSVIEAYRPGGEAGLAFWASALYEEAVADEVVDAQGRVRYRARGLGRWTRRPLTNSEFQLEPLTPGTSVSPPSVSHDEQAGYAAKMTMAASPQLNQVRFRGRHRADTVRFLSERFPDGFPVLDPAYVDPISHEIRRVPAEQPIELEGRFELWGVTATLPELSPTPIVTTPAGNVAEESKLLPRIEPPEYREILEPRNVRFEVNRLDPPAVEGGPAVVTSVLQGVGLDSFSIPAGLSLPAADYEAVLRLPGVSANAAATTPPPPRDIQSQPLVLPVCRLVELKTPVVKLSLVRDPENGTTCGQEAEVVFDVCRDALVTLLVDGQVVIGGVDRSGAPVAVTALRLSAGRHSVSLRADLLGQDLLAQAPLLLRATAVANPALGDEETGTVINELENRSSLPVGHTFVKGVDLFDGHLVQQATDLRARGRHLGLEATRTYTSAGSDPQGLLGAGWSFNYESRVFVGSCAVIVKTADGSSQAFTPLGGGLFRPQKGYHTRLVLNLDGSYDFTDKAGVLHHFREPEDPARPLGARRLDFIREPHGDELRFSYDERSRLASVAEWQPERAAVRTLVITYVPDKERRQGYDRIARLEIQPHGLVATYTYGPEGDLVSATTSTGLSWAYGYKDATDRRNVHQLASVVDPNGARTEYVYFGPDDPFPGESVTQNGIAVIANKQEFVKLVREFPERANPNRTEPTQFAYDYTQALSALYTATVRDAGGHETVYTLNRNGSPLTIAEPEGRTTTMTWAPDDVLKLSETDAKERLTEYGYDARGNLTLERIQAPGIGPVETAYAYDPRFNKLTLKRDAEGRETSYAIDPDTGDLRSMRDAVGNETVYAYDTHGQLLSVRDPRGNTTEQRDHTSYGDPQTVRDPLGNETSRVFDLRGRLTSETDTMGRSKSLAYDEQDRVAAQVRRAGGPAENDDEQTTTDYYPLGQVRSQTNGNGGTTTYRLDGMNRVVETVTPSGSIATAWNGDGTKRSEIDRRNVGRIFVYDGVHRLKSVTIATGRPGEGPIGVVGSFEYDKLGNKTLERDHAGRVTRYEYDGLYRVTRKVLPQTPYDERYAYDKVGNRLSTFDANGHETRMAYDGLNRPTSVRRDPDGLNLTTVMEYDDPEGSHVNKSADHDLTRGLRTEYAYDALNRETQRRMILQGEDGDPATSNVTYETTTAYADGSHSFTVTDARTNQTELRLDGLDRMTLRTQKDVYADGRHLVTQMSYDGLSNKKKEVDPEGRTKSWVYDVQGRLTTAADFAGSIVYDYDGEGLKTFETDRRQVKRGFTYDNLGRPRTESLATTQYSGVPWSRETRYDDTAGAWKRREKDARGNETVFHLDGLERVVKLVDPDGFFAETTWDGVNRVAEKDKRLNTTRFEYDAVDRLVKTTDPAPFEAQTVVTRYDDALNRRTDTDRRGLPTVTQMDALGRSASVTRSGVRLERHEYDGNSNRTLSEDAEGRRTGFTYDPANRLIARTDGLGTPDEATTRYGLDGSGNKVVEIDPRSSEAEPSMRYAYDGASRLTDVFDGEGDHTHYTLDGEGNRIALQEPEGQVTSYDYDELGKLLRVTQPATADHPAPVTEYGYDPNRNRVRQQDANGHVVEMTYDRLNRVDKMTQRGAPEGDLVTDHDYDANGNEIRMTDPKGQTVASGYDELNRVKTRTYAALASEVASQWRHLRGVVYGYDANGNVTRVEESQASGTDPPIETLVTTRVFDALDRMEGETTTLPAGIPKTVAYSYYGNGTRRSVTDPEGRETRYEYDGQNRLKTAITPSPPGGEGQGEGVTTYTYLPDDLRDEVRYPNGVVAKHAYDKADRLLSVANTRAAVLLSSFLYFGADPASGAVMSYDRNGNRLIQVETNGGLIETTTYGYDALNRLKSIRYPTDASFPSGRNVEYGYDAVGNRVRETERDSAGVLLADKQGSFDALNRLTSLADLVDPSQTTAFGYDRNGNQTSKTVGGVTTAYLFDARDKLIEVQQGSGVLSRFEYCYDGKRIKKIGLEGIRQYVYDQTSLFSEYDDVGASVAKYDYGSDRLISLFRRDEPRRYFSMDGLRSVVTLTSDDGSVAASYHLDAWGNHRFPAELDASKNRFGFTGYELDKETGLYNAKARYFDPQLGRFLTQDSFLGEIDNPPSLHRYFYAGNRPTFYVDSSGHDWITATDLKNAGKAFGGAVYGVGEVIAAPGVFTYQATGAFLYGVTGEWQYKGQAESFARTTDSLAATFRSPEHFVASAAEGFTTQAERFHTAIERGDPFQAGAGLGNAGGQVLVAAEGVLGMAGGLPSFATAVTAEGVTLPVAAGSTAALLGPGAAAAGILTANNTTGGGDAKTVQENTPTQENPASAKVVETKGSLAPEAPTATPKKGGAAPVRAGQLGEQVGSEVSGLPKNNRRIPSASGRRAYRVPDHMDDAERFIQEDKAVKKQYRSSQILDDKAHVLRGGEPGRVDVLVDETTEITTPLLREHLNPGSPVKVKTDTLKKQ